MYIKSYALIENALMEYNNSVRGIKSVLTTSSKVRRHIPDQIEILAAFAASFFFMGERTLLVYRKLSGIGQ